ncbi:chemotaxis protein CheA [Parasphingopyxis lamellibrachiae]|uniref:Chemotaxis protein CheA n=1 Tax=Parasphingopyxis lamellibrachiae TaxID=680125 RepID=A0A3D9FEG6_9SPHN|nr:chemotaxis protein CheW [Parasphingopyxis lamellibrachiae]RED15446.1 two-component system chemotaxis sensor kinase CheA [Parasphingopyxis lamellibrachiae]
MDDLLAEFIAETRETLGTISGEIVAWEANPKDSRRLNDVFRFVHTVKGSCGFLDLTHLQRVSHEAENALSDLRDGKREPTTGLVSAILAVIDRIGEIVDALELGEEIDESIDEPLLAALNAGEDDPEIFPAATQPASERRSPARSIRVPLELLDRLMGGVSDLVLSRNELSRQLRRTSSDDQVETAFDRMSSCIAEMRDAITWARMQRIESLFAALPRLVRDLSAELGKSVMLEIDGADVELDREMIEMLRDPLTHIVRNALDHGIEDSEERQKKGKSRDGVLRISAHQSGNKIQIVIADDGRGIDQHKLGARAVENGTLSADAVRDMDDKTLLDLVFQPGLSTADAVSTVSGRGVGMDVVRSNVERIGGTIEIESVVGEGTKLVLFVPLTLTIIPALIFGARDSRYAIPRSNIEEIVSLSKGRARIENIGGTEFAIVRENRIPVIRLGRLLEGRGQDDEVSENRDDRHLVIVRSNRRERYAIMVSAVFNHEELVVKPAAPAIMGAGIYAGTALPDNGLPLLLLDIAGLAAAAGLRLSLSRSRNEKQGEEQEPAAPDSLIFLDRDGRRRAIRMALVERIIDADVGQIAERAGRLRLVRDDETLPVATCAPLPETGTVRLLRLSDGDNMLAYAIERGTADLGSLPEQFEPAVEPGRIAGVAVVDGEPIELLDAHYLFSEFSAGQSGASHGSLSGKSRCLVVGGDSLWRHELLAPLIELAGYETTFDETDDYDLVIDASDSDYVEDVQSGDVLRLSADPSPGEDRLYRYDRTGIVNALHARLKAKG